MSYYNAGKEIDFIVAEERLAIQVSYTVSDKTTRERETALLLQFVKKHPDWSFQIVTFNERDTITTGNSI